MCGRSFDFDGQGDIAELRREIDRLQAECLDTSRLRELNLALIESIQEGVWAIDPGGRTLFANRKLGEMLGVDVAELSNHSLSDFIDATTADSAVRLVQAGGASAREDLRIRRSDGSLFWASLTASTLKDQRANAIGIVYVLDDISDRKALEQRLVERDSLFRQFGDAIEDVVWIREWPEAHVDYVSPAYEEIWGRSRDDLYRNPSDWIGAIHPEDRGRVGRVFKEQVATGGYDEEFRIVRPDGSVLWIRDRGFPVRDAKNRVHRVAGIAEEITATKRAALFRRGQSAVLEKIAAGASLDVVIDGLIRLIESLSDGMLCSILTVDEAGTLHHLAAPNLPRAYNEAIDGLATGPRVGSCGTAAHTGKRVIVEDVLVDPLWSDYREIARTHGLRASWSQPIFSAAGQVIGTFAMYYVQPKKPSASDIALIEEAAHLAGVALEHSRTTQELQNSRETLRQVIDLVPHMIFAKDRTGRMLMANEALAEAYGCSVEELIGANHDRLHSDPGEVSRMLTDDQEVIESGRRKFLPEETFTDSRGNVRVLQTTKIPFRHSISNEPAVLGVAIDITDRRRLERQLSEYVRNLESHFLVPDSLDRSNQLYDASPDFFLTLAPSGRILSANQTLIETLSLERRELLGREVSDALLYASQPQLSEVLQGVVSGRRTDEIECEIERSDGVVIETRMKARKIFDADGELAEIRVVLTDLTYRRNLERRLAQTEQLVTTGRLAASVAHEINNPLQSLLMHLSIVGESLPTGFPEMPSWQRIEEGVERIRQVVNDLLDLHRVGRSRSETICLNKLVREALGLAESKLRAAQIEVRLVLQDDLPTVQGVSQHLYQVFLNLILNAAEAIGKEGVVKIVSRTAEDRVIVEVQDDGPGIHPSDLPNIFAPLFTGRRSLGTGLGLFVTYNLVKEHGGDVQVESSLGQGTMIRVMLPCQQVSPSERQQPTAAPM